MRVRVLSLNGENMADLAPADPTAPLAAADEKRAQRLAAMVTSIDADIIGLCEGPPSADRLQRFVDERLSGRYDVHIAERRGLLGLALLVRSSLGIAAEVRPKDDCTTNFRLDRYDADNDGIKEIYNWANRVPHEVLLSSGDLGGPVTVIIVHAKSKGVFIPGDLFAYEQLSRAARMKLRAQADAVRRRLDVLVDSEGRGRVVVMGDMNDGPEFDIYAATLGGAFLEPVMGSVWDPARVFTNAHADVRTQDRWTIDFSDRILNPLGASRYGTPTEMRSWIDHILVSPQLRSSIVAGSARIHHLPRARRGTDHHPPSVELEL